MTLHLVSHALCPYVQRAAISLTEKGVVFERTTIDLAQKPEWFLAISPLGKTPALTVDGQSIFESSAILEYLEDTQPNPLHPANAITRSQHRGWIEFGSAILNDIAGLYSAKDAPAFDAKANTLRAKFSRLEEQLEAGPYFAGETFSLVDTVFGPVFRYFDTFDRILDFEILADTPKTNAWRLGLAQRPSVKTAVAPEYPKMLEQFLLRKQSYISSLVLDAKTPTQLSA